MSFYKTRISNVLVIGSGGAGLRAAIESTSLGLSVQIIGKRFKKDVHTVLAAGGINAAFGNIDSEDSWEQHFADTYIEGYGIGDSRIIEKMAKEAPNLVREIDHWGANLAKNKDGKIDQRFFGAHTYRRTCYSGDFTGRSILFTLLNKAKSLNIKIDDDEYVTQLLVDKNNCFGAVSFNRETGMKTVFLADSTIIATGGHTKIWKRSSSRKGENNGDGFYLGLKAGCKLIDMEMVQFHPTGMLKPEEMAGTLVTEAVRGEGGMLFNNLGERFMKKYDPERMELSTRDRVALACYSEITEGRCSESGGIFLDISHKGKDFIIKKLPNIYKQFLEYQRLDISKFPMEVAPTAHYSMGGIKVSPIDHSTDINGLFAAGEVAGGLHGANRLGGNSLAEILIFGKEVGISAVNYSRQLENHGRSRKVIEEAISYIDSFIKEGDEDATSITYELSEIMWKYCGVSRDGENLKIGLKMINELKKRAENIDVRVNEAGCDALIKAFDLESSLYSAEATLLAALTREESRGSHQRIDFPELDKEQIYNVLIKYNKNNFVILKEGSVIPDEELKKFIKKTKTIDDLQGKLLE